MKTASRFILFLVLISLSGLIGMSKQVQAISGACSSHKGVDCSMGRQANGTVYCNDGWPDSMVQYDFTVMCQNSDPMAGLNPECVRQATAVIQARDEQLAQTDKQIADYVDEMSTMSSDPATFQRSNAHLNYLYTIRGRINRQYIQMVVDSCKNYKAPQIQQAVPPSGSQCNNKYAYPVGNNVWRPRTVDSFCCSGDFILNNNNQCVAKIQVCKDNYGNSSAWSEIDANGNIECDCMQGFAWNPKVTACVAKIPIVSSPPVTQDQKPTIKKEEIKSEPIDGTGGAQPPIPDTNNNPTKNPPVETNTNESGLSIFAVLVLIVLGGGASWVTWKSIKNNIERL